MNVFNSIKWRLQIWYGFILVAVLVGFGFTAYQLERGRQFRRIDGELQRRGNVIAGSFRQPQRGRGPEEMSFDSPTGDRPRGPRPLGDKGDPETGRPQSREFRLPPQAVNLFDETDPNGFYYVIQGRDGQKIARSTNAPPAPDLFASTPQLPRADAPEMLPPPPPQNRGEFRELIMVTPPGRLILVGRSIAPELAELRRAACLLAGVGGAILLIGLAGGWWLASRAIRPIDDISAAAARIAGGNLAQRISTADTESELGQLAAVLNSTFARLESAFTRQQQFTADAAHELRTPVSVILTQTQGTLNRERSATDYRETLEACQRAAQRMRKLIEALLQLARLDAGTESLLREPVDLARLATECADLVRPLAAERSIVLQTDLAPANCLGNGDQLALVITNLLTNAIQHNVDGGEVQLATRVEIGTVLLTVTDKGPGVAAEQLPHLFERFYRTDAARSAHTGGAGLGLAIVKTGVEACGGKVTCRNLSPNGFQVEINLKMAPAEGAESNQLNDNSLRGSA